MSEKYDKEEGYCRMLGHFLTFDYCRTMNKGIPCRKVLDCWFQQFPVQEWIKEHYSTEEQKKIFATPQSKISSLSEILEQAQERLKEKETLQDVQEK